MSDTVERTVGETIRAMGLRARGASRALALLDTGMRNGILCAMADEIAAAGEKILEANAQDVAEARAAGLSKAAVERLVLTPARIGAMADASRGVAGLPDPVGAEIARWTRPNGLEISKVRTPIGVVGIIYESRPNVTADAAVLCVKTGNAVILRGGSEALRSNRAIAEALQRGGERAGLPADSVQLVPTTDRAAVQALAEMDEFLDVIVPRGGHGLIEAVVSHARMPVIKHYHGICAVYVDAAADPAMAAAIAVNAKCQRPGVCNAMETLLVHADALEAFLDAAFSGFAAAGVEVRADPAGFAALERRNYPKLLQATEEDWSTEYLDFVMALKVVGSAAEAVAHINGSGSHHSDAIVTSDPETARRFLAAVDSAAVYWNASTRFTDGGEFGFGAEIGISTDKLHARGPMGLEELTTYKYVVVGDGQIRQ
jgi:glutamate-5-semialdehyde dehydrogenase